MITTLLLSLAAAALALDSTGNVTAAPPSFGLKRNADRNFFTFGPFTAPFVTPSWASAASLELTQILNRTNLSTPEWLRTLQANLSQFTPIQVGAVSLAPTLSIIGILSTVPLPTIFDTIRAYLVNPVPALLTPPPFLTLPLALIPALSLGASWSIFVNLRSTGNPAALGGRAVGGATGARGRRLQGGRLSAMETGGDAEPAPSEADAALQATLSGSDPMLRQLLANLSLTFPPWNPPPRRGGNTSLAQLLALNPVEVASRLLNGSGFDAAAGVWSGWGKAVVSILESSASVLKAGATTQIASTTVGLSYEQSTGFTVNSTGTSLAAFATAGVSLGLSGSASLLLSDPLPAIKRAAELEAAQAIARNGSASPSLPPPDPLQSDPVRLVLRFPAARHRSELLDMFIALAAAHVDPEAQAFFAPLIAAMNYEARILESLTIAFVITPSVSVNLGSLAFLLPPTPAVLAATLANPQFLSLLLARVQFSLSASIAFDIVLLSGPLFQQSFALPVTLANVGRKLKLEAALMPDPTALLALKRRHLLGLAAATNQSVAIETFFLKLAVIEFDAMSLSAASSLLNTQVAATRTRLVGPDLVSATTFAASTRQVTTFRTFFSVGSRVIASITPQSA